MGGITCRYSFLVRGGTNGFLGGVSSFPDRGEVRCADEKNMSQTRTHSHYAMAWGRGGKREEAKIQIQDSTGQELLDRRRSAGGVPRSEGPPGPRRGSGNEPLTRRPGKILRGDPLDGLGIQRRVPSTSGVSEIRRSLIAPSGLIPLLSQANHPFAGTRASHKTATRGCFLPSPPRGSFSSRIRPPT